MKTQIVQKQQGQTSIQSIADLMQEISDAIREEDTGAEQTNKAAQQLNPMIQSRAQIAEETAVTVEKLLHQAEKRQRISEPSAPKAQCYVSGDVLTIGSRAAIQGDYWEEDVEWF